MSSRGLGVGVGGVRGTPVMPPYPTPLPARAQVLATEWIEIWGDMGRYGEIGARHRVDRGRAAGQVAAGGHQPAHRDGRGLLHLSAARCRILPLRSAPRRPTPYLDGTLNPSRTPTVAASSLGNLLVDARGRLVLIDAGPDTSMNPSNQSD